jgi:hypothetical protein
MAMRPRSEIHDALTKEEKVLKRGRWIWIEINGGDIRDVIGHVHHGVYLSEGS